MTLSPRYFASILAVLFLTPPLAADEPAKRVTDINTVNSGGIDHYPFGQFESPDFHLVKLGDEAFFFAEDGLHGIELWKSNGTTEGTSLVYDACPGACNGGTYTFRNYALAASSDRIFFAAADAGGIPGPWVSDGTPSGTTDLGTVVPGTVLRNPVNFVPFGALTAFYSNGWLFFSDGTLAGTQHIDLTGVPGFGTGAFPMGTVGDRLIVLSDGRLWSTNGTVAGTIKLSLTATARPVNPGSDYLSRPFPVVAGFLFFPATTTAEGTELWRTDGTPAGTAMVLNIAPLSESASPGEWAIWGNQLLFRACNVSSGCELWRTDGTSVGTQMVVDLVPGPQGSDPTELTRMGSQVFFSATTPATGQELWSTDATAAGTHLVADIRPGANSSGVSGLAALGDRVIFWANDGVLGVEPWTSSGIGASLLGDLQPGSGSSRPPLSIGSPFPVPLALNDNLALFRAETSALGVELWKTDGTPQGTGLVREINVLASSLWQNRATFGDPVAWHRLGAAGRVALFPGSDFDPALGASRPATGFGSELWRSDGSAAGTYPLTDIGPGRQSATPLFLTPVERGKRAVFSPGGFNLWVTDGTVEGTTQTTPIGPTFAVEDAVAAGRFAYFSVRSGATYTLWSTDGNPASTQSGLSGRFLAGGAIGEGALFGDPFLNGSIYYLEGGTPNWEQLAPPGAPPTNLRGAAPLGSHLAFVASDTTAGTELWITQGTSATTSRLLDLNPGTGHGFQGFLGSLSSGTLLFEASLTWSPIELWRTDGTLAGTVPVADLVPGTGSGSLSQPISAGRLLYFFVSAPNTPYRDLWASDGTAAGTQLITPRAMLPTEAVAVGTGLVFAAWDPTFGYEPWVSDGTTIGTRRLQDIAPGPLPSSPFGFKVAGANLYFGANDAVTGFEVWRVPLSRLPGVEIFRDGFQSGNLSAWSTHAP